MWHLILFWQSSFNTELDEISLEVMLLFPNKFAPWGFCLMAKGMSSPGGAGLPWVHPGAMLEGTLVCPEMWAALGSGQSPRLWLNQSLLHSSRPHFSLGQILHPEAGAVGNRLVAVGRLSCEDNSAPRIIMHHFQVHPVKELLVLMSFFPKLQGNA